jgi:GAF domain-containing protein
MEIAIIENMKARLSILLTGIVAIVGVIIIFLVNLTQQEILETYNDNQPLIQVSDNLKYKTTVGHLWFEEFMAGDQSINPERDVISQFESSGKILIGMLNGSTTELGTFEKIDDADMKATVRKTLEELNELKKYTRERWSNKVARDRNMASDTTEAAFAVTSEQAGGDLDTKFDAAFEKTQLSLDEFKLLVKHKVDRDVAAVGKLSFFVSTLLAVIFIGMAYMVFKFQKRNEKTADDQNIKLEKEKIKLESMTSFANHIGQGNYEYTLAIDEHEKDSLAKALINMKEKLNSVAEEDKKRNWINIGFAKISEIIRNNNHTDDFYFSMVSFLVQYLNANQGGLFIINNQNENDKFIELKACLAYERKKFLQKRIEIGEGLIGRCMQEAASIYMTQIPENYITITSGLGEANPSCLLLVPLKVNTEIFGIVEIASFNGLAPYQIEFVEKIAESIGSAIAGVKMNERTKLLLEKAQQQAEELRAQEEEMRQNLEELATTQEEMLRKEREYMQIIETLQQQVK